MTLAVLLTALATGVLLLCYVAARTDAATAERRDDLGALALANRPEPIPAVAPAETVHVEDFRT